MSPSDDPIRTYFSRTRLYKNPNDGTSPDAAILTANDWDDFGAKNMFNLTLYIGDESIYVGRLRIIVQSAESSASYFSEHALSSDGVVDFPFTKALYLSLPETPDVYERLLAALSLRRVFDLLRAIHDVSYLKSTGYERDHLEKLESTAAYSNSLMRGTTELRAFERGLMLHATQGAMEVERFSASISLPWLFQPLLLNFDFSLSPLSTPISILIGRNGAGKTQALELLAQRLSGRGSRQQYKSSRRDVTLTPEPSFGQVTSISYSVYDHFPVDDLEAYAKDATYLHFGFRTKHRTISKAAARGRAAEALVKMLNDHEHPIVRSDSERIPLLLRSLTKIEVDTIRLWFSSESASYTVDITEGESGVMLSSRERLGLIKKSKPIDARFELLTAGQPAILSAGQSQYVLQLIVLAAYLQKRSILLIDEPELGLHPNLEVDYIRSLKDMLVRFQSAAILATHSPYFVRETRACQVQILERDGDQCWTREPRFETFGSNVSKISDEIFGDLDADPAYEDQLQDIAAKSSSFGEFYDKYAELISPTAMRYARTALFEEDAPKHE